MRRVLAAAVLALSVTGCTSGSGSAHQSAAPTATEINPCEGKNPAPGCVQPTSTTFPYPPDAAKVPAVSLEPVDGEIARADNSANPARRSAVMTIVVPRGRVIASELACQGRGSVAITTSPTSQAEQEISCDGNEVASRLGVFASSAETADRTYVVTVKADGPSRWVVAMAGRG